MLSTSQPLFKTKGKVSQGKVSSSIKRNSPGIPLPLTTSAFFVFHMTEIAVHVRIIVICMEKMLYI